MAIETNYIDIPISGNNKQGNYVYNNTALDNSFRLWISSAKNEYLRRQGGNWLLKHIGKPMNEERALEIKRDLNTGISTEFIPQLTILRLDVTPDYTKRRWIIELVAYSEKLRVGLNQKYFVSNEV